MNNTITQVIRQNAAQGRVGASLFVASLDSASLPDMGDRSLDQETHAYIRPRRRTKPAVANVIRRSGLPFPEPRLPNVGSSASTTVPKAESPNRTNEREFRQLEENAGLRFMRTFDAPKPAEAKANVVDPKTVSAADSQGVISAGIPKPKSDALRRAAAGQAFVFAPRARESELVIQPPFDLNRPATVVRRLTQPVTAKASQSLESPKGAARFASLEEGISRMAENKSARIAVLAIGVSDGAIGKVGRLADVLRERYSRKVEVLAAEHLSGLKMAPTLVGENAGEVCLVACQAGTPHQTLPFLAQFDGVILMVEIGETPVDDAAAWAEAIRRNETPIVGVWAA